MSCPALAMSLACPEGGWFWTYPNVVRGTSQREGLLYYSLRGLSGAQGPMMGSPFFSFWASSRLRARRTSRRSLVEVKL
jgi:hypothetical protein